MGLIAKYPYFSPLFEAIDQTEVDEAWRDFNDDFNDDLHLNAFHQEL